MSRILVPAIATAIALSLGVSSVESAIPNPTNKKFYACFSKKTGAVRLINYPKVSTCPKGQRLVSWNAKGPAGPTGPQGPQGPAGPADWNAIPNIPAGFADGVDNLGVTGLRVTRVPSGHLPVQGTGVFPKAIEAPCPPDSILIGGGFSTSEYDEVSIVGSSPKGGGAQIWQVLAVNPDGPTIYVSAVAFCLTVEPPSALTTAKKSVKVAKKRK